MPTSPPERIVSFHVFAPDNMIRERGCTHVFDTTPGCRTCDITIESRRLVGDGLLECRMYVAEHAEYPGVSGQHVVGSYASDCDAARLVVTRMLAFLHGHRDPMELAAELELARA